MATLRCGASWLVVVDMQQAFLHHKGPWSTGDNGRNIIPHIKSLADRWGPQRTIFTRYIARKEGEEFRGAWKEYFADSANKLYDRSSDDWVFDIVPELKHLAGTTVTMPTFSKWGDSSHGLRAQITEPYPQLVLTGVSAACCVWSTAVAAADAGAHVTIVGDACAASCNDVRDYIWQNVLLPYKGLINLVSVMDLLQSTA